MQLCDIAPIRLQSQHISQADFERPEDVVRHMLGMQAQDYPGALWSIGLRTKSCTRKDIEQAVIDRKIIRTWPMRGTLHFMHADDAAWMVKLLAGRATAAAMTRRLSLGLNDTAMEEIEEALRTLLAGGKIMRRDELRTQLAMTVKATTIGNEQFSHILRNFGEQAMICFGPHDGKQPTFVLMEDWLPKQIEKNRAEALGELAKRYFASHGPAQLIDFASWGMLKITDARLALELTRPDLESIVVSDTTYYLARNQPPAVSPCAFLLPGFDEYILGYKDRRSVMAAKYSQLVVPGNNGMFKATIVLDGQVAGTWKSKVSKGQVELTLDWFDKSASPNNERFDKIKQKYQEFINC